MYILNEQKHGVLINHHKAFLTSIKTFLKVTPELLLDVLEMLLEVLGLHDSYCMVPHAISQSRPPLG